MSPGQHGESFAKVLGLTEVVEGGDSTMRDGGEPASDHTSGALVSERLTPSNSGKMDRVWSTWVNPTPSVVRELKRKTGVLAKRP